MRLSAGSLALLFALVGASICHAEVLVYSNFSELPAWGPGIIGDEGNVGYNSYAQCLFFPTEMRDISRIDLTLGWIYSLGGDLPGYTGGPDSTVTITLNAADENLLPAGVLDSWTITKLQQPVPQLETLRLSSPLTIKPGEFYWLTFLPGTSSAVIIGEAATDDFLWNAAQTSPGGPFEGAGPMPVGFRLYSGSPAPEPAPACIAGGGLLAMLAWRRRRRSSLVS